MDSGCRFFTTQKVDGAFKMQYLNHYGANSHLNITLHTRIIQQKKSKCVSLKSRISLLSSICPFFLYMAMNRAREEKKRMLGKSVIEQQNKIHLCF